MWKVQLLERVALPEVLGVEHLAVPVVDVVVLEAVAEEAGWVVRTTPLRFWLVTSLFS